MSGKVQVNYTEVYAKTAKLKADIESELSSMENEYTLIRGYLDKVDGATKAKLIEAMENNRKKALIASNTLKKLLSFMSNSARQIELAEQRIANTYIGSAAQN